MVHTVIKGQNFNLLNDVLIKLGQMINLVSYFPKGHLHLLGLALVCHYQLLYFVLILWIALFFFFFFAGGVEQ